MTVKDLIELLQQYPVDAEVLVYNDNDWAEPTIQTPVVKGVDGIVMLSAATWASELMPSIAGILGERREHEEHLARVEKNRSMGKVVCSGGKWTRREA